MATYKDIAATTEGRVGIVEIRKPPHNFFDVSLINQIADALEAFDADNATAMRMTPRCTIMPPFARPTNPRQP